MSDVVTSDQYRTVLDLSVATKVSGRTILRHLAQGKFKADKPGRDPLFNQEQWDAAIAWYKDHRRGARAATRRRRQTGGNNAKA